MRLALLPVCLVALPLSAQWDLRLELPRPSGQSLPQTLLSGTGQLASGDLDQGRGFIASANRRLFQLGPLLKLEGGMEVSQFTADGSLSQGSTTQATRLKQQGLGVGINAQLWVPFVGIAGEFGLIQRLQHYRFDTAGASSTKDLSRTWLRVGARWRVPSVVVHPYLAASYQQPVTKDRPVKLSSSSDLAAYFSAQGSGQEFERMWTFGVGVTF
ncbi:MAG: hypothetical protein HXX12_10490 [Geothrix sp.]|uniref:hypothetical protein n=1 Tax=Geothrix sp. TaxID=1962974 RepID=UPI0017B4E7EE|nr:hypothetical protein [Geothrix sp.]NWJ41386.1 hypothetical protein [Geothrix sp.]WIL20627.1 MAG: hypothetical protein QOZ81_003206 [Geothrix sp.]